MIKGLDSVSHVNPGAFYFVETARRSEDSYITNPSVPPSQLVEIAQNLDKVLWICDRPRGARVRARQTSCEVINQILTEQGHIHYRLDSKTSHSELLSRLKSLPSKFIVTGNIEELTINTSGESDLSIDIFGYFDAVCFDICSTEGVNGLIELSAQLKDSNMPIYVACPEVNITPDLDSYTKTKINEVINAWIDIGVERKKEIGGEIVNSQFVNEMFQDMGEKFGSDRSFLELLHNVQKQAGYEHENLRLYLTNALIKAGNPVIDLTSCDM